MSNKVISFKNEMIQAEHRESKDEINMTIPRDATRVPAFSLEARALDIVARDQPLYFGLKRIMDVVVAGVLLFILSPLMLLIAFAIVIYSPGPVFFVQERVGSRRKGRGKNFRWEQRNFRCFKFRTMHVNADPSIHQAYVKALIEKDEAQMQAVQEIATQPCKRSTPEQVLASQHAPTRPRKLVDDKRVIRPGRILRKLSLDELPQFWNVLIGDMSLVGPRPAIPYEVEMYKPWHRLRLQAQPGITGLQQVTKRCIADFDEQVELDIEYIKNQSLWQDLKIAFKTPLAIIMARGAH